MIYPSYAAETYYGVRCELYMRPSGGCVVLRLVGHGETAKVEHKFSDPVRALDMWDRLIDIGAGIN